MAGLSSRLRTIIGTPSMRRYLMAGERSQWTKTLIFEHILGWQLEKNQVQGLKILNMCICEEFIHNWPHIKYEL